MGSAILLLAAAALILAFSFRPLVRAVRNPSPGGAILITSMSYLAGSSILVLRDGTGPEIDVLRICCVFLPPFLLGYFGAARSLGLALEIRADRVPQVAKKKSASTQIWAFFLMILTLVLIAVYISGTDRILLAIYQFIFLGDTGISVIDLRLGFATGEDGYFAPGYIKQLRDILLPLSALLVLFAIPRGGRRLLWVLAWVVPVVALLMISSGERGPVLLFLLATTYSAILSVRMGAIDRKTIVTPLLVIWIVGGSVFAALTSTYTTRNYEDSSFGSILVDRIVTTVPAENSDTYQVWGKGAPFLGAGWISELSTILPGKHIVLSTQLHDELGGGDKGNSVLGTWADVFFNFDWTAGVIASLFIGIFFAIYGNWVNSRRMRSPVAAICGLWISITMLTVYSPFGFILYGPFILSFILVIISRRRRRHFDRS